MHGPSDSWSPARPVGGGLMKGGCVSPELQPGLTCGRRGGKGEEVGEEERDERGKSEMNCGGRKEAGRSSRPRGIKIDPEEVPSICNSIWITQAVCQQVATIPRPFLMFGV